MRDNAIPFTTPEDCRDRDPNPEVMMALPKIARLFRAAHAQSGSAHPHSLKDENRC
jgi:hypothetical protein